MPRNYNNRHLRAQWNVVTMQNAVDKVINDSWSMKRVAREYSVPRLTLRRHVMKAQRGLPCVKKLGRTAVLTPDQENELVDLILTMVKRMFGLTQMDIRRLVFSYCEQNKIKHFFSQKVRAAGRDWFEAFLRRHPNLTTRTPEPTSIQRVIGFNSAKAAKFLKMLGEILFDSNGQRVIPVTHIYNVDESGYSICHKPPKVVAQKGQRSVGAITSAEKGKTITAICCMSATGHYVPPMLIFPRHRIKPELMDRAPPGAVSACSPSGWVNEEIFSKWFDHFIAVVQPGSRPQSTLLILDGHSSHMKNLSVIIKARENNVIILSLPSHCTHRLQPLDVAFFKSCNAHYNTAVGNWMRQHARAVSEYQVAELFAEAYRKAATLQIAESGFVKCGINPFNASLFDDDDFVAAELTDRPEETAETNITPVQRY